MHLDRTDQDRPRLTLFGGPLLLRKVGVPVLLTPSHERLLTLVWGHEDRGVTRSAAIWLLWEEDDTPRFRQRLRQLLHDLGARLGFRPLDTRDPARLVPASGLMTSDLDDFQRLLGVSDLQGALGLFRLGFGARLDGRTGGQEYEDWLLSKREALRRRLADAAARTWDRARSGGAWPEALRAAEVLAELDPVSEAFALKLVEARALTGGIHQAEEAAAAFLSRIPPGRRLPREVPALLERIRKMRPAPAASPPTALSDPPLVGREQALLIARRTLHRVLEGSFEFLLLKGEGGAGKTRLMEEIRREALLAGFRCLQARPVELERRIPLNPLVDMLADPQASAVIRRLGEPWRAVIASLLPVLPPGTDPPVVPPISENSLSRRLYDAFAILLSAMADSGPHLLFLDDLQWADTTTLAVLQFVQRRWRTGPLGVVAAIRPELIDSSHEAARYLTHTPDLPATVVELADLSDKEARTLLDLVAGRELEPTVVERLLALGGRNPFYLIELTRDLIAGRVQLPELPTEAITLPISLIQLVEPRIQELSEAATNVASHLAVWGRSIALGELATLAGGSLEDTAAAVEELERGRLASVKHGCVSLGHELFRSTIYQRLSATRRSVLHGRIAHFLNDQREQQPGETAIHFSRAGNSAGAAVRGREAADRALESGAMAEAAYFLQLVVDNVADPVLKAEATADLARVLHINREITRANPMLELAALRLRAVCRHAQALRMDIRRVEGLAELGAVPLGDLLDRLATIKSLARSANDDEALALALDSELHLLHRSGKVPEIHRLFAEIRPLAASPNRAAACLANSALALNVLFGDAQEALTCAREAVRIAEGGEADQHRLHAYSRLTLVLVYQGLAGTPEGRSTVAKATKAAERSGDLTLRAYTELNQGVFAMDFGALDAAAEHFENTFKILGRSLPGLPHVTLLYNQGELLIQQERYAEARVALRRAASYASSTTPVHLTSLITAGVGLCSLELGDLALAREHDVLLGAMPQFFYFDPTTILDFRARLLARRGQAGAVLEEVETTAAALRFRLPVAWLRITILAGGLCIRLRRPPPAWLADAISVAERLQHHHALRGLEALRRRTGAA